MRQGPTGPPPLWLIVLVVVGLVFAAVTIGAQDVRGMTVVLVTALFGLFTTIAVAALGTVVAYALGHKQTRNEKQAEVLIELRRKYLGLSKQLHIFSGPLPPDDELEQIESMQPDIDAMLKYFHNERMYLDPNLTEQARGICGGFLQHLDDMRRARRADAGLSKRHPSYREEFGHARQKMEQWREGELPKLLEDLEEAIHKLRSTRRTLRDAVRELFGSG